MKPITLPRRVGLCAALLIALTSSGGPLLATKLLELREYSLDLVNSARADEGLPPLALDQTLNRSAEAHAEDMLERDYFSHVSPEGDDVMDRYLAAGGSHWRLVTENIGQCANCAAPVSESDIERQHENWMQSPEHRANILAIGLDSYGFGLAAEGGELYAVQNFSGPGMPRGVAGDDTPKPLRPDELAALAADLVNDRRAEQDVAPLEADEVLVDAAYDLLPDDLNRVALDNLSLMDALPPNARGDWRQLAVISGSCGGCGVEPTDADVRYFIAHWFDDPRHGDMLVDPDLDRLGFALLADGEGRKIGLALLGAR